MPLFTTTGEPVSCFPCWELTPVAAEFQRGSVIAGQEPPLRYASAEVKSRSLFVGEETELVLRRDTVNSTYLGTVCSALRGGGVGAAVAAPRRGSPSH